LCSSHVGAVRYSLTSRLYHVVPGVPGTWYQVPGSTWSTRYKHLVLADQARRLPTVVIHSRGSILAWIGLRPGHQAAII